MARQTLSLPSTVAITLLLGGCGGVAPVITPAPTPTPVPVIPSLLSNLPGDWAAIGAVTPGTPPILPSPIISFTGAISSSGTTITGNFRALGTLSPSVCPSVFTPIAFSGTLDAANNLTLTAPLSGGQATITAALSQDLQTYTPGSYKIVGGTCAMPATPMHLAQFAPVVGTFTGTLNALDLMTLAPVPGTATTITAVLAQSTSPSADGTFPLTGTVTSTGACAGKVSVTNGTVFGGAVLGVPLLQTNPPTAEFNGAVNPSATTLFGTYSLFAACPNSFYQGILTRQ